MIPLIMQIVKENFEKNTVPCNRQRNKSKEIRLNRKTRAFDPIDPCGLLD